MATSDTLPLNVPLKFKGDNGEFLRILAQGDMYLQFSSREDNEKVECFEVQEIQNGSVAIKSLSNGKYWGVPSDNNWIVADSDNPNNKTFWFRPVEHNMTERTFYLKSESNNNYCRRFTSDNITDCLNACAPGPISEANLTWEKCDDHLEDAGASGLTSV